MHWFAESGKSSSNRHGGERFRLFGPDEMPLAMRLSAVQQYGDQSLSYATAIQTGLRHFGNENALIAFQQKYGYTFVLGDPVANPNDREQIIDGFLGQFKNAAFCQITRSTAELLQSRRFWINQLGIDTRIDLPDYDFRGKQKERFRYAVNWLMRRGYQIRELPDTADVRSKVDAIVRDWRKTRTVKSCETAFINRPLDHTPQVDMRRFFLLDASGDPLAFVFFDPLYRQNRIIGYVTSFKRRRPEAPSMAEQGICKVAIDRFREEGRELLRLGLSPLAKLQDGDFRYNWMLRKSMQYGFQARWINHYVYNLKGHAAFKSRFRGREEKTWFASPTFANDLRLFALLRLCRIL